MVALEENLKDEVFENNIINSMTYICGTDGKSRGLNSCYKVIDLFVSREFIEKCSWTGNSYSKVHKATQSNSKNALKQFVRFRKCFLEIILRSDKEFSETQCDQFFKQVLRNSKQRSNSKRQILSASKIRPSRLNYLKKLMPNNLISAETLLRMSDSSVVKMEKIISDDNLSDGDDVNVSD